MSGDAEYCYPPHFIVLKNKLNIRDADALDRVERRFVVARLAREVPRGAFDLKHLKAIHHHLFQDIYDWAGELRTVEMSKTGHQFQFRRFIETGMADIHYRLIGLDFLRKLTLSGFAAQAGKIMGDLNYVHPFREGNGRVQLVYLEQLAAGAGHPIDPRKIDQRSWIEASRSAHVGKYGEMSNCIALAVSHPANNSLPAYSASSRQLLPL